jgi:polar amino acid transport system permease protein
VGLGVYVGAYFAEIFRAGVESIPKGQLEAAACLGMSRSMCLRRIVLPQMPSLIIPAGINQVIILIKDSAVLSIITVPELTKQAAKIVNLTFAIWEPYLVLALLYWGIVEAVSRLGNTCELRLTRHLRTQ